MIFAAFLMMAVSAGLSAQRGTWRQATDAELA